VAPACARQCPGRAVWFGMLDDEEGPVAKLVNTWQVALPLHPEYGTEPNVFYIPPIGPARLNDDFSFDEGTPRIPTEYLESLFGPKVRTAVDTLKTEMARTRNGGKSELMDLLIAYVWKDMFTPYDRDPAEITVAQQCLVTIAKDEASVAPMIATSRDTAGNPAGRIRSQCRTAWHPRLRLGHELPARVGQAAGVVEHFIDDGRLRGAPQRDEHLARRRAVPALRLPDVSTFFFMSLRRPDFRPFCRSGNTRCRGASLRPDHTDCGRRRSQASSAAHVSLRNPGCGTPATQ